MEDQIAAKRFFEGFYRDPQATFALGAFRTWLAKPEPDPNGVASMFVRAIRFYPEVRAAFETMQGQNTSAESLLKATSDPDFPDPAKVALDHPSALDFQWSEFLLTGSKAR
jgi:hypothetical protein